MKRMNYVSLLAGLLCVLPVCAQETDASSPFSLKGYGTLGMVYHDTAGVEYRRDISQASTGARAGQLSTDQDSMLALQADYRGAAGFDATAQVVSRQDAENSYAPQLTMAKLQYRSGDGRIQLGRQLIEAYLEGDAAEIGYANTMVRQPVIHYPRVMDGVGGDVVYPLGQGLLRLNGQVGRFVGKSKSGGAVYDLSGSDALEGGIIYQYGAWQGRLSAGRTTFRNEATDLLPGGGFAVLLPGLPNGDLLRGKFSMQERKISHRMLELAYDSAGVKMQTGYSIYSSPHVPLQHYYTLHGSYRIADLTPYAVFTRKWAKREFIGTGLPDGLSSQVDTLNRVLLDAETMLISNQTEIALGVRYDFMADYALKLQWDRFHFQDTQTLIDRNAMLTSPVTRGFRTVDLYSLVLDFRF